VNQRRKQAPVQPFVRRGGEARPLVAERGASLRRYVVVSAFLLAAPLACVERETVQPHLGGAVAPVYPTSSVPTVSTITPPATTATPPPIEPVVVPVNGGAMPVSTGCPNDHPTS
jgi:hypothetical protein